MRASLNFRLPEDSSEFNAAICGSRALAALWQIEQHLRAKLKYGEPGAEAERLAEEVREIIPQDLLEESWT